MCSFGRTAEPTDALGQVRVNHVAFVETRDGINETVGRAHARLQFDSASGHYHLFNEGKLRLVFVHRDQARHHGRHFYSYKPHLVSERRARECVFRIALDCQTDVETEI